MNETEKRIVKQSWTGQYIVQVKERGIFGGEKWVTWATPRDSEGYGDSYHFNTPEEAENYYNEYQKRCAPDKIVKYF